MSSSLGMSEGMYELTARAFYDNSNLGHCAVKHKKEAV